MTRQAIVEWESRAKKHLEDGQSSKITNLLLEIGRRSELLADESRDVFKIGELVLSGDLKQAKTSLKEILAPLA